MMNFARLLAVIIIGSLLTFACGLGNYAAYISMLAALGSLAVPANWAQARDAVGLWSVRCFLLAYLALAIPILVQALNGGDAIIVFDFLPFGLSLPAAMALGTLSGRAWPGRLYAFAVVGVCVAFAVVAVEQFLFDDARPRGLENSPIHYGILAATLGFLAFGGFLSRPSRRRSLYLAGPLLGVGAALLTGTRAVVPVIGLLVLVTAVCAVAIFRIPLRRVILFGLLAVLVGGAAGSVLLISGTGAERAVTGLGRALAAVAGEVQADTSMAYRIEQYRAFFPAFADAPFFGHGWHQQLEAAYSYLSEFGQRGYDRQGWGYIHNEALSMTLGMGVFGLAAYVLIFSAPILGLVQKRSSPGFGDRAFGVIIVWTGIFAGGLTDVLFMAELPKTFLVMVTLGFLATGSPTTRQGVAQ